MYIAFKWLIGLALIMWITMCGIDIFVKRYIENKQEGVDFKTLTITNSTVPEISEVEFPRQRFLKQVSEKPQSIPFLHYFMFLAGAVMVSIYNKKDEIILFTRRRITEINTQAIVDNLQGFSKRTASQTSVVTIKYSKIIWVNIKNVVSNLRNRICSLLFRKGLQKPRINVMLLKKLQEVGEERKNLGQLLIAAIHENKNIRMQYQLESMAKNRLARHIENTEKLIKENRSRYVSFQQLYLVTHQENTFLKSRMQKLIKEKDEAEKNLLELMNEVYKSKNNELKAYCGRFIVRTKDNLLNSDISAEIHKFLEKSRTTRTTTSNWQLSEHPGDSAASTWQKCPNPLNAEIIQDDVLVPLVSDAPKLKGLPGECVWTVKDKDGLIERLYEYDYESDLDNGDTIRRIRQYSVYHDKDCLLDFSNRSTTIINDSSDPELHTQYYGVHQPITSQGFLTRSEAFQRFLTNNKNFVPTPQLSGPPLLPA